MLLAVGPVPRKPVDLAIVEPSGKQMLLSQYQGRVVLVEFLLTNCPRCMRVSHMVAKLHRDLGPRGFQPIGIAFDNGVSWETVKAFVHDFEITYPIGTCNSTAVDSFLGRAPDEKLRVPQLVLLDRHGVVRAQSGAQGDPNLEDESYLRNLISDYLKDPR